MTGSTVAAMGGLAEAGRSVLLIADDPVHAARASDAVSIAGGRIIAQFDWSVAAAVIEMHPAVDAILLEAEGVSADRLAALLSAADALARDQRAVLVVALTTDQIDIVTAHILGHHAQLLCMPSVAERVAALVMARGSGTGRVNDRANEAESERLRRLNEEVARIAETLARLTRREPDGAAPVRAAGLLGDRTLSYGAPPLVNDAIAIPATEVRQAIRARRLRD